MSKTIRILQTANDGKEFLAIVSAFQKDSTISDLRNEISDGELLDNKNKEFVMTLSTWRLSSSTNKKLLQWTEKTRIQYFKSPASRLKVQNQRWRVGNFLSTRIRGKSLKSEMIYSAE